MLTYDEAAESDLTMTVAKAINEIENHGVCAVVIESRLHMHMHDEAPLSVMAEIVPIAAGQVSVAAVLLWLGY